MDSFGIIIYMDAEPCLYNCGLELHKLFFLFQVKVHKGAVYSIFPLGNLHIHVVCNESVAMVMIMALYYVARKPASRKLVLFT